MKTSTANFSITLKPSKALVVSLSLLYLLAAVSILLISIPVLIKALLLIMLLFMACNTIKRYALYKAENSIKKLSCTKDNNCRIELNNGQVYQAKLIKADWLFNYFALLVLQTNKKKFNLTIAKDAMSQEQSYVLRLYLRSLNTLR